MKNNLMVHIKTVYGVDRVYPSCKQSHEVSKLLGVKTFNEFQMKQLQVLGFTFEFVAYQPKGFSDAY